MADVTFNIYGGNNQILPNATKAEQNFYGDQFAEKALAKDGEAPQPLTEEEQALSIYIKRWNPCEATSPSFAPARQRETWARWWQPCDSKSHPSPMS